MDKIVPSGGGDPTVFLFVHLCANEASSVSSAKSADGSDINKSVLVDTGRDQTITDGNVDVARVGELNSGRCGKSILRLRNERGLTGHNDEMNGT